MENRRALASLRRDRPREGRQRDLDRRRRRKERQAEVRRAAVAVIDWGERLRRDGPGRIRVIVIVAVSVIARQLAMGDTKADRLVARAVRVVGPVAREVEDGREDAAAEVGKQQRDRKPSV